MTTHTDNHWYNLLANGVELFLYIKPGAKQNEIIGLHAGKLKIKIHASPKDGKANKELIKYLASICNVPPSQIELKKGKNARIKTLFILGAPEQVLSSLKNNN